MTDKQRLEKLLEASEENEGLFGVNPRSGEQEGLGYVPRHFKRCSLTAEQMRRYSLLGMLQIGSAYGEPTFFTQSLIAGVCLSGDFDKIGVITSSQVGKSWTMGRVALLMAYNGHPVNIAAATGDLTDKIMRHCLSAAARSTPDIKKALTSDALKKVDKLDQTLSKTRLSFPGRGRGQVQAFTLGDTFSGISHNKAVGEGGSYIIDEAAFVSEQAMAEIGRREFSTLGDEKEPLIMISNPHNPGYFYSFMTQDDADLGARECIIWTDALTMAQEGRKSREAILSSDFAKMPDTIQRYLLCELPTQGEGMFPAPTIRNTSGADARAITVLGIDAAYKGKDYIEIAQCDIEPGKLYIPAVEQIKKTDEWIEGVTSQDIIAHIAKVYHRLGCAMCCVDEGYGVWLKEGLLLHGVNARGIQFGGGPTKDRIREKHYAATNAKNKRAEMHLDLAELMENRAVEFSEQAAKRIAETLPFVTSERKTGGKIQVIPKPEIKAKLGHSPDALDAVLLAVHAAILYSDNDVAYITDEAV